MLQYLYEWIQNITFYMILTTALFHILPGTHYKKYIRFFTGMILILLILTPLFYLFGEESPVMNFYQSREFEKAVEEIEKTADEIDYSKEDIARWERKDIQKNETEKRQEGAEDGIRVDEIQIK